MECNLEVDAEGHDVRCKTVTSILSAVGKIADPYKTYMEGTIGTDLIDPVHVKKSDVITKSSVASWEMEDGH